MDFSSTALASTSQQASNNLDAKPSVSNANSQFKHTNLWNNVVANLSKKLIESALANNNASVTHDSVSYFYSSNPSSKTSHPNFKLRKQHSRFVAASVVSGMLNMKENLSLHNPNASSFSLNLTKTPRKSRTNIEITSLTSTSTLVNPNIYFTGSQCVDIVFRYLSGNDHMYTFQEAITREKTTKVPFLTKLRIHL